MSCVWMLQRGHSGNGCVLALTLCKYDLRKRYLFVMSWAWVRRVMRGSISSFNRSPQLGAVGPVVVRLRSWFVSDVKTSVLLYSALIRV